MILSIGMIVKNEEKYLRRCLEAIQPILEHVDSELIIADTGSTDSTVEIARAFTDKVFHFEWCDDFSAARNSVLEKAKGEWFMSLDADEIFKDVDEIIDFFTSKEQKKYRSATYIIRNYNSSDRSKYSDFDALRIGRIEEDTRYVNPIHEARPYHPPTKKFESVADHYGYLTEGDEEFIQNKVQRNLNMLLPVLEKDPANCKNYFETGQTYCLINDYQSALKYFYKGLELAKEQKNPMQLAFYGDIARVKYVMKQYSEVLDVVREYFDSKNKKSDIDLQMYFLEGSCSIKAHKYQDSIAAYNKYFKLYKSYHMSNSRTEDSSQYLVNFADEYNYRTACLNLTGVYIHEQDYDSAERVISLIPFSDWNENDANYKLRIKLELDLMNATGNYAPLIPLYKQLQGESLTHLQTSLEPLLWNDQKRNLILSEIAGSDLPSTDYIKLQKLRYNYYCLQSLNQESVEAFIEANNVWGAPYSDAIYFALSCGLDISLIASKVTAYDLMQLLLSGRFMLFPDLPQLAYRTLEKNCDCTEAGSQLWLSTLAMWTLCSGQLTKDQIIRLFHCYAEISSSFFAKVYKEDFLTEENADLLPIQLRVGYYSSLAEKARKAGDKSKYIANLKTVLKLYPSLLSVVELLLDELQKSLDDEGKKADAQSALEKYAQVVKANIGKLIDSGQLAQAAELLTAYEQISPNDPEIKEIRKRI